MFGRIRIVVALDSLRRQLVRSGETIDVYDSSAGYKSYDVASISRSGSTVEIEATDAATGEAKTLEMDGD